MDNLGLLLCVGVPLGIVLVGWWLLWKHLGNSPRF